MEKENWVEKTFVPQQGKPDKNIYSITEEGRCELSRWLSDGDLGINPRTPILMNLLPKHKVTENSSILFWESED